MYYTMVNVLSNHCKEQPPAVYDHFYMHGSFPMLLTFNVQLSNATNDISIIAKVFFVYLFMGPQMAHIRSSQKPKATSCMKQNSLQINKNFKIFIFKL